MSSKSFGQLTVNGRMTSEYEKVMTPGAMMFIEVLVKQFVSRRRDLLKARDAKQSTFDKGGLPDFLPETEWVRQAHWKVREIPKDLQDRRVEITGPVDRKMVINALNANVKVFMADFEDSLSPTWDNVVQGQINLHDAVKREISYTRPASGATPEKVYTLKKDPAVLICRTRGLHLDEKHITIQDDKGQEQAIPGCLFDFGLYFYHNYRLLLDQDSGPYFYLPKLQSHLEARWWNDVFCYAQSQVGMPRGTIRATVLIETLPAVFEMDEILYELREHIVGLNCGRWDYIFSYIKTLRNHADRILPDRQMVTMDKPFLSAYSRLLIKTCHRRGAFAMGGMAAFIPQKDSEKNQQVTSKVKADKQLEADNGHDGTWVAHPGLADIALSVFDQALGNHANQLHVTRADDAPIRAQDLLAVPEGEYTEAGMRANIRVALQYIEAWLSGNGCVPIYGLMEDAATAEISRTSIWQWIKHGKALDNGCTVTKELFQTYLSQEYDAVKQELGNERFNQGRFEAAKDLLSQLACQNTLEEFLTLPGYQRI